MAETASWLGGILIPVGAFVAAGFLLRRRLGVGMGALGRVGLYVFSPALVFQSIVTSRLSGHDLWGIGAFAAAMAATGVGISRAAGRLFRLPPAEQAAWDLATTFSNTANLGLPVVAFALGTQSLHAAVLFVLTQVVLVNTVGAYLAGQSGLDPRSAWGRIVRLPALWALLAAVAWRLVGWPLPVGLARALSAGSEAYSPTVLLVLGGALADWRAGEDRRLDRPAAWGLTLLRLTVMPLAAVAWVKLLGLSGPTERALILELAMPVAVNALILAQEFEAAPLVVGQAVALSTLAAAVTVPAWLWLLVRG
ncbi:MAG: AEC family transporter [Firmicutes bacterium]|nr:AEC family transporter [Alicyclobacillaceae bacterium]MCL6496262.1 AEC family transporter [Bacillota bacterium]